MDGVTVPLRVGVECEIIGERPMLRVEYIREGPGAVLWRGPGARQAAGIISFIAHPRVLRHLQAWQGVQSDAATPASPFTSGGGARVVALSQDMTLRYQR